MAFRPLNMNFTGTLEIAIIATRNKVATAYPRNVWNRNTEIRNPRVPRNLVRGSSL